MGWSRVAEEEDDAAVVRAEAKGSGREAIVADCDDSTSGVCQERLLAQSGAMQHNLAHLFGPKKHSDKPVLRLVHLFRRHDTHTLPSFPLDVSVALSPPLPARRASLHTLLPFSLPLPLFVSLATEESLQRRQVRQEKVVSCDEFGEREDAGVRSRGSRGREGEVGELRV